MGFTVGQLRPSPGPCLASRAALSGNASHVVLTRSLNRSAPRPCAGWLRCWVPREDGACDKCYHR